MLVGLLAQKAEVKYDKNAITTDEIVYHVKGMGFGCGLMNQVGQGQSAVEIIVSQQFVVSILSCFCNILCSYG